MKKAFPVIFLIAIVASFTLSCYARENIKSIKFRVVAFNPSATENQDIEVKVYLPQEIKKKDILNTGGLKLKFDSKQSLYYVYKPKVTLEPKQLEVFFVEVEDIWHIPESELTDLRIKTESICERLKDTEYYTNANIISNSIYGWLEKIATSQSNEYISREEHIGIYRKNLKIVDSIKREIVNMEKALINGGPLIPSMPLKAKVKSETGPKEEIETEAGQKESVQPDEEIPQSRFDGRNWKLGYKKRDTERLIVEYVLEGETVNNWSELVTAQTFFGLQEEMTPEEVMEFAKRQLLDLFPQVVWNVVKKDASGLIYEWALTDDPVEDDQYEIACIISDDNGIHIVHYATKHIPVSSDKRQKWMEILDSAAIKSIF